MSDTSSVVVDADEGFTRSAGKQLALYALYAIAAVAAVMFVLSVAAGGAGSSATGNAIDVENNSITIALREEPPQMDAARATDASSNVVLSHVMEGLISYDLDAQPIPGVAERWEIREDGATFWLRENALWSDGVPVTAHDFVFSWRRVLNPETASQYAFILYPIKNAEAVNTGQLPVETLGVRAAGDRILEVEFERPTPYFDKLVSYLTYFPTREDFFKSTNGRYGSAWH